MADIIQLQEKGVKKYIMTTVEGVKDIDTLRGEVLWEGSAKQGDTLTLTGSVQNYTALLLVISFGGGNHNSVFMPDDADATCVGTNIYNSLSTTVSICKYVVQKKSDTSYIVSVGRENSGSSTMENSNVTGTVAKIIGIV